MCIRDSPYEQLCPVCGDMRHIVMDVRFFSRPQLWKAKAVKAPAEPSVPEETLLRK